MRRGFVLPASTKTLVKQDDDEQLIALGPRQVQLCGKKLLLCFKDFVVAGFAGDVSLGRELDGCFQCGHLPHSLFTNFGKPFARGERI